MGQLPKRRASKRDHPTVVEVLSAYVRERTAPEVKLGGDVQAALTVLGRLPSRAGVSRGDLRGANLTEARLGGANLTGASLNEADLTEANLIGADLTKANLNGANLTKASLNEADLTGAYLFGANLTGAYLFTADLTGAYLFAANLTGAGLVTAKGLVQKQLDGAIGDSQMVLPAGLHRPKAWSAKEGPKPG